MDFGFQTAVRGNERYLHAARRTLTRLQRALPGNEELRPLGELLIREGLLVEPS